MDEDQESQPVKIYTDGACSPNPGPGGWAVLFILRSVARYVSGYHPYTTNNRMELCAAINALKTLNQATTAEVHTDSRYLQDGINSWIHSWQQRNWRKFDGKPVVNQDLWMELINQVSVHKVDWKWVRGHSSDKYNNFVDALARDAISRRMGVDVRLSTRELEETMKGRMLKRRRKPEPQSPPSP
jgi:ribonuclease HI